MRLVLLSWLLASVHGWPCLLRPELSARLCSWSNDAAQCVCGYSPRIVVACMGCRTWLLHGTALLSRNRIKPQLTARSSRDLTHHN
jgi:hypothetical protein